MTQETQPGELPRVSRIVDVRIPLWGLLCALGTASFFLISMYFTTNQTARDVAELQITVKAGNTQVTTLAGEQALLRPEQPVFTSPTAEGSAFGAAALVLDTLGQKPFANETRQVAPAELFGLEAYRDAWKAMAEIDEPEATQPRKEFHA